MANVIRDAIDLRRGRAKAQENIEAITRFEADHSAHHVADPEWDCHPNSADFYQELEKRALLITKPLERTGYVQRFQEWREERQKAEIAEAMASARFIPVELNGDESGEDIIRKAMNAIATDSELQKLEDGEETK